MPILNYTTKISTAKTAGEIQEILVKAGAASIRIDYEDGEAVSISFLLVIGNNQTPFRLPSYWQGVYKLISKDPAIRWQLRTEAQAKRIAWRIVKDWAEAQIAFLQSGQASMTQLFLPYAVQRSGRTFYEEVAANPRLLLAADDEENPS